MHNVRVIPTLLISSEGLVKTRQFKAPRYVGDPINAVRIFNEKEVDELVFLDIDATKKNTPPQFELIEQIASEAFMPVAYGGGIKTIDEIRSLLRLGVEKVVLNSCLGKDTKLIEEASSLFGSQSIVVSVDVKKPLFRGYRVHLVNGTKNTGQDPVTYAKKLEEAGAGEIFLNSIDRDGTLQGYDLELISMVSESVDIPVIACGGASNLDDFRQAIKTGGASAVAAGSMFVFHGKHQAVLITYPDYTELRNLFS
jgi:cyclase